MIRTCHPTRSSAFVAGMAVLAALVLAPLADARSPSVGRTVNVKRVSGKVRVKPFGAASYRVLTATRTIRMGSTVDATRGRVKVTAATGSGRATQSGEFYDGAFKVSQARARAAVVELRLARGDFSRCGRASARTAQSRRAIRRLWGKARGRFRTVGRHAAATIRGTTWLTEDFCETSRAESREGTVAASSTVAAEPSFTSQVLQGATFNLEPGQSLEVYCAPSAPGNLAGVYCLLVLSQPADNAFAFGFLVHNTQLGQYGLCVTGPQPDDCGILPLTAPDESGFRTSAVACAPMATAQRGTPADYTVTWILGGEALPVPIRFSSVMPTFSMDCISQPPP
jgi:hypothetical protein